jgi:hypothetical protein
MTSDAELTGLDDDIAELIAAHGPDKEDFISEALLFYAEQVLLVHADGICSRYIEVPMVIPMNDPSYLPNAIAVLNALGLYELPTLDGRAHEVDAVLADQKQDAAAAHDDDVADAHESARSQAAFDFA